MKSPELDQKQDIAHILKVQKGLVEAVILAAQVDTTEDPRSSHKIAEQLIRDGYVSISMPNSVN